MITKKYYKLVKVSYADSDYFRITNVDTTAGTLTIGAGGNLDKNLEYSTDGVNWTTAASNAPFSLAVPAGSNVYMRGSNNTWTTGTSSSSGGKTILMDVDHTVGGNVMSLLKKDTYSTETTIPAFGFMKMFMNNTKLIDAKDMNFGNCTNISNNALFQMFSGCTNLKSSPQLTFTSYGNNYSLRQTFDGCSSLNTIICLVEGSNISYENFTRNVSANGIFYKSQNGTWTTGANGIPSNWTVADY